MQRYLRRLLVLAFALTLAFGLGACGDAANNNDNLSGTATTGGSASPGGIDSADGAAPGGSDNSGGGTTGNSNGGSANPGP